MSSGSQPGPGVAPPRSTGGRAWVRIVPDVARRSVLVLVRELVLLLTLLWVYTGARIVADADISAAYHHAYTVLDIEDWLYLPAEQHLQRALLAWEPMARLANTYYSTAHLLVTGVGLFWLLLRRPDCYRWARRAIVGASSAALVVYVLLPVAPPRLIPGRGFVDTAQLLGQSVYSAGGPTSLADQFAAMPSLHVGWSVLIATVCIGASTTRWRWVWLVHPLVTVLVVVATGNHYWLDVLAGAALAAIATSATRPGPRGRSPLAAVAEVGDIPAVAASSRTGSDGLPAAARVYSAGTTSGQQG